MKKVIYILIAIITLSFASHAQNDTMYIMKAGVITAKYHVTNQMDSIIFYKPTTNNNITTVTDASGNTYKTITIGTQTWMAENLRSTKYSDGTTISLITDATQWAANYNNNTTLPMMSWYNNDQATHTANKYGALYNWYAVSPITNGNKNVCPTGWHVPTDAEWTILIDYLGGSSAAGGKMKSTGTQYWNCPNTGATNEIGFSGLPGGVRIIDGTFGYIGENGNWWSSTETDATHAWDRYLYNTNGTADSDKNYKEYGFSVRCLKD